MTVQFSQQQVDSLVRELGVAADLLEAIAERIHVWGVCDRESFVDIFVESEQVDWMPKIAETWR